MTKTQAKMIIWNPDTYPVEKKREAIAFILGSLNAKAEDIKQAMSIA